MHAHTHTHTHTQMRLWFSFLKFMHKLKELSFSCINSFSTKDYICSHLYLLLIDIEL